MAVTGRVQVLDEVLHDEESGRSLCFQRCRYVFDNGTIEEGFRFIWRHADGRLQGARGQARIPSLRIAQVLLDQAVAAGWGHWNAEGPKARFKEAE